MSIPEVILPCPQTHSSWLQWWHCHLPKHHGLLSSFSRNVNCTFSNLLSLYLPLTLAIKPLTSPRPCSSLVSMMQFFLPTFLLGINHFKTQVLLGHFHTHSALLSHLQLDITAFPVRGPCFFHSFSILPTKCTKSSCHCVLNMLFLPNLPQLSCLLRHLPCPPHMHPNHLLCPQPQMLPSSITVVQLLQGTVNMLIPPSRKGGPLGVGTCLLQHCILCLAHSWHKQATVSEWMNEYRVWYSGWLYHEERLLNILFLLLHSPHHEISSGHLLLSLCRSFSRTWTLGTPW